LRRWRRHLQRLLRVRGARRRQEHHRREHYQPDTPPHRLCRVQQDFPDLNSTIKISELAHCWVEKARNSKLDLNFAFAGGLLFVRA
jgi:hypothetical protein